MGPSQSQLRLLSAEDRIVYKQWLRRGVLFYSSAMALLILAAFASHVLAPPDVAGDTMHTASMSAQK